MSLENGKVDNRVLDFIKTRETERDSLIEVIKQNTDATKELKTAVVDLDKSVKTQNEKFQIYQTSIPLNVVAWMFGIITIAIAGIEAARFYFPKP